MIKIFADGAKIEEMLELNKDYNIAGFTTNPTLMKAAGITDYTKFAKEILSKIKKPISFEVFSDDQEEMKKQAIKISKWGKNVYVKIPITDTLGNSNTFLMRELSGMGIKVNATAITTIEQIDDVIAALKSETPAIISIFAGRIADTGLYPWPYIMRGHLRKEKNQEILWASCREVINYIDAQKNGADIITMPPAIYKKMKQQFNKKLEQVSLETVQQFYNDAQESGFKL